jgi:multimeric flavodoxin WrbA
VRKILVVFQTTQEPTEHLALAVALGAVQGGADIRLRHLDPSPSSKLTHGEYGTLREADLLWADGFVVGVEADSPTEQLKQFANTIRQLGEQQKLSGKHGWVFGPKNAGGANSAAVAHLDSVMRSAGMLLLEDASPSEAAIAATSESINQVGRKMAQI